MILSRVLIFYQSSVVSLEVSEYLCLLVLLLMSSSPENLDYAMHGGG